MVFVNARFFWELRDGLIFGDNFLFLFPSIYTSRFGAIEYRNKCFLSGCIHWLVSFTLVDVMLWLFENYKQFAGKTFFSDGVIIADVFASMDDPTRHRVGMLQMVSY